jgi:hypothetical protein
MRQTWIKSILLISIIALAGQAKTSTVSGVAVTIQGADSTGYAGKLLKMVITNGAVASTTMLLKDSIITNVIMSTDGQKVAYFKANKFWGPDSVNIMMLDINGGTPVNISKDICPHNMDYSVDMDWPTGDWIYYMKGIDLSDCSKEVWKVNVTTREKAKVWTTLTASGADSAHLWLFSLSNDATKAITRTNEWFYFPPNTGGPLNIFWFTRPPDGDTLRFSAPPPAGMKGGEGCGTAVSCDGAYVIIMGTLNHNVLSVCNWNTGANVFDCPFGTMANWNGNFGQGSGGDNTFSANSPKWVCLSVGWDGRDGSGGSNQVLINWQDSVVIRTTNALEATTSPNHQYNGVGDFWVGTPGTTVSKAANPTISPNGGNFTDSVRITLACATTGASIYYTTNGQSPDSLKQLYSTGFWVKATTTVKARAYKSGYIKSDSSSAVFTKTTSGAAVPVKTVRIMENAPATVFDMLGRKISSGVSKNVTWDGTTLHGATLSRGVYFVQIRSNGTRRTQKLLVP